MIEAEGATAPLTELLHSRNEGMDFHTNRFNVVHRKSLQIHVLRFFIN